MSNITSATSIIQSGWDTLYSSIAHNFDHARQRFSFPKFGDLLNSIKQKFNLRNSSSFPRRGRLPGQKPNWLPTALMVAVVIAFIGGGFLLLKKTNKTNASDSKVAVTPANKTIELNREFTFPIREGEGEETGMEIKYTIEKVELADEIVVKGQKATAVSGRTFLLLYLKLVNNEDVGIEIDTRDFVRVKVDDSEESLAADIHNDPVEVQPLSTKFTRIGFPVDDTVSHVKLIVGEIKSDKTEIDVDF